MGTSAERSSSNTEYYKRGDLIPGIQVNGMDIIAVHQASKWAKEWVTSDKGPLLVEFVTYRYAGHSYVGSVHCASLRLNARSSQYVRPWYHLPYP